MMDGRLSEDLSLPLNRDSIADDLDREQSAERKSEGLGEDSRFSIFLTEAEAESLRSNTNNAEFQRKKRFFLWCGAAFGVRFPGTDQQMQVLAIFANTMQVTALCAGIYFAIIYGNSGVNTVANDLLNVIAILVPFIFLQVYSRTRAIRDHETGEISKHLSAWISTGFPGWKNWYIPATLIPHMLSNVLLLIVEFKYRTPGNGAFLFMCNCANNGLTCGGILACFCATAQYTHSIQILTYELSSSSWSSSSSSSSLSTKSEFLLRSPQSNFVAHSLNYLKKNLDALQYRLARDTRFVDAFFIIPQSCVYFLTIMNSLWFLYNYVEADDDKFLDDKKSDIFNLLFMSIVGAKCRFSFSLSF